jgi:hypothetical protein
VGAAEPLICHTTPLPLIAKLRLPDQTEIGVAVA